MRYFLKTCFIFGLPCIFALAYIVYLDFFKVFFSYKDYYKTNTFITLNRENVCFKMYTSNVPAKKYDAFILGNSRSLAFKTTNWKPYLPPKAIPFHFDANGEGIYGVLKKLEYIHKTGKEVNQALLVLDRKSLTVLSNRQGHVYVSPPEVSGESYFKFYYMFLKASLNFDFLRSFIDYKVTHKYKDYMGDFISKSEFSPRIDPVTADFYYGYDTHIAKDSLGYYKSLVDKGVFYTRTGKKKEHCAISTKEVEILNGIKKEFKDLNTNYQIVISPLYDQIPLEKNQLDLLNSIFGKDKVHDFSGVNSYTSSIANYYESSHYRPHIARDIMRKIYTND